MLLFFYTFQCIKKVIKITLNLEYHQKCVTAQSNKSAKQILNDSHSRKFDQNVFSDFLFFQVRTKPG